jgi:thiamine-phosphate pyrophosphorylase
METGDSSHAATAAGVWRACDASANRAGEALRVIEDALRFMRDDAFLSQTAKNLRHDLASLLRQGDFATRSALRDVAGDVGLGSRAEAVLPRGTVADILAANAARAAQALRSLEECTAMVAPAAVTAFERLRYRVYALERAALTAVRAAERLRDVTLCVLVDGRRDAAAFSSLVESLFTVGVRMIQIRDKNLPVPTLVERARAALEIARRRAHDTAAPPPLVVVNDRADVAAALAADGVHTGADDLPTPLVRRVVGPQAILGRTAHTLAEAREAVLDGADYLGVGPCFPSPTKAFATHAPPGFLHAVAAEIGLPTFAIGGITLDRLDAVAACGLRRVAVASAVVAAADPAAAARAFIARLESLPTP